MRQCRLSCRRCKRLRATGIPVVVVKNGTTGITRLLILVCTSDTLAHGVLTEVASRGIAIPGHIAVMGFGDMNFAAHTFPALSTVKIDDAYIGQRGGGLA